MTSFKFFIGRYNMDEPVFDGIRLLTSIFANNLINSGEFETTLYPKTYRFFGYSLLVHSVTIGMKINDEGFEPYVEHYHNVSITYLTNDRTIQITYDFRI